jgi:acyl transferase domain-containing protein
MKKIKSVENTKARYSDSDIAIVGIDLRFPGAASVSEFWENLVDGKELITFFTDEELIADGEDKNLINKKNYVKTNGSILENKEYFDASFFNFTPLEALLLDPQTRVLMECVHGAVEDAGFSLQDKKNKVGLFVGASSSLYWELLTHIYAKENNIDDFMVMNLAKKDVISTWISHKLNLTGPSVSIQSACSTSLFGIDLACRSLRDGQCNAAIVGGASITKFKKRGYLYQDGMIFSKDGHNRAFDAEASGMVSGEGVAAIVLRKANDALRDGDNIYGIVKGVGVNNDGNRKVGFYAPSVQGQTEAILLALENSKVLSRDINYVETHGTGTIIGDAIEIEALKKAYNTSEKEYCALGAVKSNIGHLDVCAGLAGLIKAVLVLKNKKIPPILNVLKPNPKLDLDNSPFYLNTELKELKETQSLQKAGVSSFGIGGTNVHVILEEARTAPSSDTSGEWQMIYLSAKNQNSLEQKRLDFIEYLKNNKEENLADISYTLLKGRDNYRFKLSCVTSSVSETIETLENADPRKVDYKNDAYLNKPVVFVFTGQGTQYINMGKDIYASEKYFRDIMDYCFSKISQYYDISLKDILFAEEDTELIKAKLGSQEILQPILFILEYSLARLLMHWGIVPASMIGYSIGEYVAACLADVMTLDDALMLVCKRGKVMQKAPEGVMISVPLNENDVQAYLNDKISLAAVNGDSCIISGNSEDITQLERTLRAKKILAFRLSITCAGHSPMMENILQEFENEFDSVELKAPKIPFTSNITGKYILPEEAMSKEYWVSQISKTTRFYDCIKTAMKNNLPVFIELGPGQEVSALVKRVISDDESEPEVINLIRHKTRDISDHKYLKIKLLQIFSNNINIEWDKFFEAENRKKVQLPKYPLNKSKYWLEGDLYNLGMGGSDAKMKVESFQGDDDSNDQNNDQFVSNRTNITSDYIEPTNPQEEKMQKLWCDFFGLKRIGIKDNFLELGGDSLKAINLINIIYEKFETKILLKDFFANPTIHNICEHIENQGVESFIKIKKAEKKEYYLASFAQKRVFFVQYMDENSTTYNMPQFCILEGDIDINKIENSFNEIIRRHECLRTSFVLQNEEPVQIIKDNCTINLPVIESNEESIKEIASEFIKYFVLSEAPLIRVGLIKLSPEKVVLMVDMHHIISDLISYGIIIDEFMSLYNDDKLPHQELQYKDFTEWQYAQAKSGILADQEAFWLNEFKDNIPDLNLPYDYERPTYLPPDGNLVKFEAGEEILNKLNLWAKDRNTTLFINIISVYYIFLSKICCQDDIVVGTPSVGRRHPSLYKIIGKFVNMLSIRSLVDENISFSQYLDNVKLKFMEVLDNQDYQYDELIDKLKFKLDNNKNPIFNVAFSLVNVMSEVSGKLNILNDKNLKITQEELVEYKMSKFDLVLHASIYPDKINFMLEYSTGLFKEETVLGFKDGFKNILEQVVENEELLIKDIHLETGFYECTTNLYDSEEADFDF